MTDRPNDILLLAGQVLAVLMQIAMAVGALALIVATPLLRIFRSGVIAEFASESGAPEAAFPLLQLAGVMAIGFAIVVMLFFFFGTLRRIIATVSKAIPSLPSMPTGCH